MIKTLRTTVKRNINSWQDGRTISNKQILKNRKIVHLYSWSEVGHNCRGILQETKDVHTILSELESHRIYKGIINCLYDMA